MSSIIRVAEDLKIAQRSMLDFAEFYSKIILWSNLRGFNFNEKEYRDQDDPRGKQVEIIWEGSTDYDDYAKFTIEVQIRILGLNAVELEKNGSKLKTFKGDFTIKVNSYVTLDYNNDFQTPFKKFLRRIYDRFIVKDRIESYKKNLDGATQELVSEIKSFFSMFGAPE
ncbi:MAG TPA: hypothetical protein VJB94_00960 [Candidatus Nanoarchaeia archaeon]|nr:hypothetical protein [Candidatus Nanoarchaeia archaeon]